MVAALLDINSGSLFAREAVQALGDLGRRFGVTIHGGKRAVEVVPESAECGVRFSDGTGDSLRPRTIAAAPRKQSAGAARRGRQ